MRRPILGILFVPTLLLAGDGVEPGLAIRRTAAEHLKANRKAEALQSLRILMDLHTGYDPGQLFRLKAGSTRVEPLPARLHAPE